MIAEGHHRRGDTLRWSRKLAEDMGAHQIVDRMNDAIQISPYAAIGLSHGHPGNIKPGAQPGKRILEALISHFHYEIDYADCRLSADEAFQSIGRLPVPHRRVC